MRKAYLAIICGLAFSLSSVISSTAADKRTEAINLYNAKDYKGAATLLDDYLTINSRDPYAAYYGALANQQIGNSARARMLYRQVYTLAPGSQVGGYAKNMLLKLDPSFAQSQATTAKTSGSALPTSEEGLAKAIVDLPSEEESMALDPTMPAECRIPFKKSYSGINLEGYINGRPVMMKFDTGAPNVVLGKNHLQTLGIKEPTGKPDGSTGGSASGTPVPFWMMQATVKVGPMEKRDMPIMVLEYDHSMPLLGQTFFKSYDTNIDSSSGQINFRQKAITAKQSLSGAAVSVPYTFKEEGNRILVDVEVNGKPVKMIFDTGNTANACSFMSEKQAEKAGLKVPADARLATHIGVNGSGMCRVFPVQRMKLGPIDRSNIYVSANLDMDDNGGLEAPILGQPFWEGYEYTIDRKKKLIHFVRR